MSEGKKEGKEAKPGVVFYRPTRGEETIALLVALFGGLAYISAVTNSHCSMNGPIDLIAQIIVYTVLGYILVILLRETITRPALTFLAKLRVRQVQAIAREACGKELSEKEAVELLNKAQAEILGSRKRRREGK